MPLPPDPPRDAAGGLQHSLETSPLGQIQGRCLHARGERIAHIGRMLAQPGEGLTAYGTPRHSAGAAEGIVGRGIPLLAVAPQGMPAERQPQPGDDTKHLARRFRLPLAHQLHAEPGFPQCFENRLRDKTGPDQDRAVPPWQIGLSGAQALRPADNRTPLILRRLAAAHHDRGAGGADGFSRTQSLADRIGIARRNGIGRRQDRPRGAVVGLELDRRRSGRKILTEAANMSDLRAAPAIDGLAVVADGEDTAMARCQQTQQAVLGRIRVLILVDEDFAPAALTSGRPGLHPPSWREPAG